MSMVKKIIDIIFPVRALPKDDDERAKVIGGFKKSIQMGSKNVNRLLLGSILVLVFFSAPITNLFSVFNDFICVCLIPPTTLYLLCLILYLIYKARNVANAKLFYLIYVLCNDVLAMSGFIFLIGILDLNYDYKIFFILLCVMLLGYCAGYWYYYVKFNAAMINEFQRSHIRGAEVTIIILGCFIMKFLTPNTKLFLMSVCGLLLAILPAQEFVYYRQFDNIQRAKKGESFK